MFKITGQLYSNRTDETLPQENLSTQKRKGLPDWGGDPELMLALKDREN